MKSSSMMKSCGGFISVILAWLTISIQTIYAQREYDPTDRARARQGQWQENRKHKGDVVDETRDEDEEKSNEEASPLSTEALLPRLKGVRLVGNPSLVSETEPVKFSTTKIIAEEGFLKVPPPDSSVLAAAEPFLGEPVSIASLKEMSDAMIDAYRKTNYPLVDIYLPPQNVTEGVVQFVVIEATLGEKKVEGARYSKVEFLLRQIRIEPGDRINSVRVEEDLEYINENPFRQVDLIYRRGDSEGTSDIILQTKDLKPYRFYIEWGNTGVELTGENEISTGFTLGQIAGTEQLLSYNYTADEDFGNLHAHSVFYQIPLENRDAIHFLAAYVASEGQVPTAIGPLGITGENIQFSGEYRKRLPPLIRRSTHRLVLGIDYKSTNNNLIFGGADLFAQPTEVFQYKAGYEFNLRDDLGFTSFELYGIYSPGNVLAENSDENFRAFRDGATADYSYGTLKIERFTRLPKDYGLRTELAYQYTDQALLSTEQSLAGGYRTLRGLPESFLRGDRGIRTQIELIAPPVPIISRIDGQLQTLAFLDAARFDLVGGASDDPVSNPSAVTAGLGIDCHLGSNVRGRASYGWVLESTGPARPGSNHGDGRFHFGLSVSY